MRQETRRAVVAPARERSVPPLPTPSAPPSATLFRTALVVFTLVVSGLFVGTGLYDAMVDNGTEGRRAAAAVAGALVVVGLACALLLVEPVVVRHRLRLTPAGRPFAPALWAVAELGAAEGTRVHGVLIGPATLRRPFVVGRPGDYRIVLPPALARLEDPALFRTLVRHELTALGRRDVARRGWRARCATSWARCSPSPSSSSWRTASRRRPPSASGTACCWSAWCCSRWARGGPRGARPC